MADREVSWKAVANFASLVAQSASAKKALKELRQEEDKLAASFEADSARITAASKSQNDAIRNSAKGFDDASKASKSNADQVVRDSKRKESSYKAEENALHNIERAHRELDVSEKKSADAGQRLSAINRALAQAADDVAKAEERRATAQKSGDKTTRDSIKSEQDLLNARKSRQRIEAASAQAASDRARAVSQAAKEEARAETARIAALRAAQVEEEKAARAAESLAAARANAARSSRETEATAIRTTRAVSDNTSAVEHATVASRQDEAATISNRNAKKTFLQVLQNVQNLQKGYKGTVDSVAAAQVNHARALNRSLAATRELEHAQADLNAAQSSRSSSAAEIVSGEQRLAATRELLSHASEDVSNAENDLSRARASSGVGSREAVAAEENLNNARRSAQRISSSAVSIENDIAHARSVNLSASRVIEGSEARINNARQRGTLAGNALVRATTRLNGEMNASSSIVKQLGNTFSSLSTIFSGMADGFKDIVGLFGKMALVLLPQLLPLIGALGGGFAAVTSSIAPMAGLLGALPGLLIGAITGFTAIKGAFSGISQAMKAYSTQQAKSAAGGTQAAKVAKDNARAIADAQRAVSDAKKNAATADKEASQRVAKAARDAAEANAAAADKVKQAYADEAKAAKDASLKVSEAKKQAASDVKAANQAVIDAEKNLQSAQAESVKAQDALNNVRKDAIQELEDMKKAARDASFSEREATLNLIDARNKLAQVKEDPHSSDSEVAKAQLDYEEAQARLHDAEEAKKQANQANSEAQAKGIKGTQAYTTAQSAAAQAAQKVADAQASLGQAQQQQADTVVKAAQSIAQAESDAAQSRREAAKQVADAKKQQAKTERDGIESLAAARQAQAKTEAQGAESIRKAQENVAKAMDTAKNATSSASRAANAYQTALAKLTPAQRQFVNFLIGLKPKLDKLRETAAKNLLPGVEAGIRGALPLFPAFDRSVGNTAKSLGDAAAKIGKTLGSGEGFGAMQRILKTNDDALKVAAGSSGHYTLALLRIGDAARPLITWIGHLVAQFGQYLDKSTKTNKQNGDMAKFFDSAKRSAQLFGGIVKNIAGIIWGIGKASKGAGDDLNVGFLKHLEKMNKSINSEKGQNRLKKWFKDITPVVKAVGHVFGNLGRSIGKLSGLGNKKKGGGLQNLTDILNGMANGIGPNSPLIKFFDKLNQSGAQKKTFDALGGLFKSVLNFAQSKGGQTTLSVMATELDLISSALGAIMKNKVGAAVLTTLMVTAATVKVAKFAGASTGISSIVRMSRNSASRRQAAGRRSLTNRVTGGRIGRGASGGGTTGAIAGAAGDSAQAETQGTNVGRMYTQGIANGITESQRNVLNSIDGVTTELINRTRRNLDEHSPSRVAYKIGDFYTQGFANGIKGDTKQVVAATDAVEAAAIRGISSADDKMLIAGKEAGSAYARGLKSASKNASISSSQLAAAGTKSASGAEKNRMAPGVIAARQEEQRQPTRRGAKLRGAAGGIGGAAMMGSMFLPGKGGEIAGEAGMALMMVSMLPKLETVKKAISGITKALKLQTIAQKIGAAAAKLYAAMQWLVNIAMDANPIALIIIGLVALGVAFYILWTKSKTFRKIVTEAFDAIKNAAVTVYNWFKNIGSKMFNFIKTAASFVFNWLKKNWGLILAILTAPFGGMYVYLIIKFWPQIIGFLNKLWGWIKGAFAKVWSGVKAVLLAPFNAVKWAINQIFDSKSGLRKILNSLWGWVSSVFKKAWGGIKKIFTYPIELAKTAFENLFGAKSGLRKIMSSLWGWVSGTFKKLWNGLKSIVTSPISAAKSWIGSALGAGKNGLQHVFTNAVAGIKNIWNGLKAILVAPINFMRTKVFKGLANAYNWIVGKIPGAGKLKIDTGGNPFTPIKLAAGGRVNGNSPTPTADNVPAMLTAGEWVQPVSTVKHYGSGVMEAIRQRRIPKEALARFSGGGYAEGPESNVLGSNNKRKKRILQAHLRDGGLVGTDGYSLGSFGGAATLSSYYDETATGPHEHATGSGARIGGDGGSLGSSWSVNGASVPYRPGMHAALVNYGRTLRGRGMSVLENPAFGRVHPVHMAGSLHYVGEAMDVSGGPGWPGTGNKVYNEALQKGFAAIWQSSGHYDHVHIDTGMWKEFHNKTSKIFAAGGDMPTLSGVGYADDEGNWITKSFSTLKDLIGGLNPLGKLQGAIKSVSQVADSSSIGQMLGAIAKAPINLAVSALKNAFFGSDAYEGNQKGQEDMGLGVTRWTGTVKKALKMLGIPDNPEYVKHWLTQIGWESSGNPNAIQGNIGDINNRTGQLARGLAQVVPGTFSAYHMKGHNNIFNGLDNLLAGMRYAKATYGLKGFSNFIGVGKKHGYAEGGHVAGHGNTDSVKAMLMPGEFVIRREAARRIGYGTLNQMNNIDRPGRATAFSNGGSVSSGIRHYATGGQVAPADGKPINGMLMPGGNRMLGWKMVRELLGLKTKRGMSPAPDNWDSEVTSAFVKRAYRIADLPVISHLRSDVPKLLQPLTKLLQYGASQLPGSSYMEKGPYINAGNAKKHSSLVRLAQKVMGLPVDGVWGNKTAVGVERWKSAHGYKPTPDISSATWKQLAQERFPDSYRGGLGKSNDRHTRVEDVANRYGISMWQAATLGQGANADYIKKHTLAASNKWFLNDAKDFGASTGLGGAMIKSYQSMFGASKDGVWSTGMADWMTYAMRKEMGQKTDTIFPPWWTLDPLQRGIEDQSKSNKDLKEFLGDLDILSGWGFGYLVDKLQSDGVDDGLPTARVAVKNRDLAQQYDEQLKETSTLNATGSEDFTKFVAAVVAPGVQQGIRSLAQSLGMADFAVVDMYDKLIKSGRLKKGERTSRLDKEVTQFKSGLFYAATGGRVPGTGSGDTVPAMLTPGEFVLRKAAVKAIGMENLYNLNNMQKFSTGGPVYSFAELGGFQSAMSSVRTGSNLYDNRLFERGHDTPLAHTDSNGKTVNNYTTINNPRPERSTSSINRQLRKNAALGFMNVRDDVTKVND